MKTEIWTIENGKLVCNYETYRGHWGVKVFVCSGKNGETYSFKEEGTNYGLGCVSWNNLTKSYTPLYNNTKFAAFIKADLKQL